LRIQGRIDRLDLAANRRLARVIDYKTGRPRDPGILNGGSELQRCLYAYAVKSLLGAGVRVEAALLFPRGENANYYKLEDTEAALHILAEALLHAHKSLQSGNALPGPDTAGTYDDLAFALPASQGALTDHKRAAAKEMLGEAAAIWDQA
jgi:RecB family exonuclease